jgi:hydroxymethylglutaryl-CoA lyase
MQKNSPHERVEIFEVGARDGLQNEKSLLSLDDKEWLVRSLVAAGLTDLEGGAFVRADRIPQMADSDALAERLEKLNSSHTANIYYLVPNVKGFERALAKGVRNIALFSATSNTFNKNNIGMTVDESFVAMEKVVTLAKKENMKIRGYVSTVWGCPFEGRITTAQSLPVLERMLSLGVDQLSIGDTIGIAAPTGVEAILKPLLAKQGVDSKKIAVHFHDTRGTALANALRAYELGIRVFDSSIGGLGGCPFAPGAAGNLATEDLIYLFKEMQIETGVDYTKLCETSIELFSRMKDRPLASKALQAFVANRAKPIWDRS